MSLIAPAPLADTHGLDAFDCGKPSLDQWLKRHARQAQASGSARTYIVADADRAAGYFSLAVGHIENMDEPERVRKGMGQYPIPVMILARLAVCRHYQGQGIGAGMLKDAVRRTLAVAEQAGVRGMLTHPIDDAAAEFYARFGFVASPLQEKQMVLLLKDARRFASVTPPGQASKTK